MRLWHTLPVLLLSLLIATLLVPGTAAAAAKKTQRVSVSSAGVQGNNYSGGNAPSVSADGRYVVFDSPASNLVAGDSNGYEDVFVRDRKLHRTYLVSVSSAGVQGNGDSFAPSISADGRYVAFVSQASNLVAGDSNGFRDVFVRDRKLHKTYLVSVGPAGVRGNGDSTDPSISADGRYVAFDSLASNLVAGDSNGSYDVFVRDLKLHRTYRVSVSSAGAQGDNGSYSPSVSANGRYVAFASDATNLVAGDANGYSDVFLRDRKLHKTYLVSVGPAGVQGNGDSVDASISADGRYVAFDSVASNLVAGDSNGYRDVFVRDRKLHKTFRVSVSSAGVQGNNYSESPAISADGRSVAFDSAASNLVAGDSNAATDVFLRVRTLHKTVRVSVDSAGVQGGADSYEAAISSDSRYVAFNSDASNLVAGDTNGYEDVFVRGAYR